MVKTIAIDIDDVMAATAEDWVDFSNKKWGTSLTVEDYTEDWAQIWGMDHMAVEERARVMHDSSLYTDVPVHDQAQAVLQELSRHYRLVVATSRVMRIHQDTLNWLERYFKGVFSGVHSSGIFDKNLSAEAQLMTKARLINEIGADYLIDDQIKHCFAVAEAGVEAILFGDYPWNKAEALPPGVVRCSNWLAVKEYFDGRD